MTLATLDVDASAPSPTTGALHGGSLGTLRLEDLSAEILATMLHPAQYQQYPEEDSGRTFAELVAFPLHDTWRPLAECLTSLARIVEA